jgi:hypothetical protein
LLYDVVASIQGSTSTDVTGDRWNVMLLCAPSALQVFPQSLAIEAMVAQAHYNLQVPLPVSGELGHSWRLGCRALGPEADNRAGITLARLALWVPWKETVISALKLSKLE